MKADLSRQTFDSKKHYSAVVMQQGRVQVDADWNEQQAIHNYRIETETKDVIGKCGAPAQDAGFKVVIGDENLIKITPGRYYVNGLLCENEAEISYEEQPDFPNPPNVFELLEKAETRAGIFYLDVWQRHITILDDLTLREVALGDADTATRVQTIWQVKFLPISDQEIDIEAIRTLLKELVSRLQELRNSTENQEALEILDRLINSINSVLDLPPEQLEEALRSSPQTLQIFLTSFNPRLKELEELDLKLERVYEILLPLEEIADELADSLQNQTCCSSFKEWQELIAPDTGQLNARTKPVPPEENPCLVPPNAGYQRLENQLYRVEIHDAGSLDKATFKWSRDNGSVVTAIENISGQEVTVQSVGPDNLLGFASNQWVEISDDTSELNQQPGELLQIDQVDPATRIITLKSAPNTPFDPTQNPKLRRWDSRGLLSVEIPDNNEGWIALESGIEVKFSSGTYRTGDYWLIPARTATGEIEWSPSRTDRYNQIHQFPLGVYHQYCRLAFAKLQPQNQRLNLQDCRKIFQPVANSAMHVTQINWLNDDIFSLEQLQNGLVIQLDSPPEPESINAATLIVTLEVPLPLGGQEETEPTARNLPDLSFILDGDITTFTNLILWRPVASQIEAILQSFQQSSTPIPLLMRVTLKGDKIWSGMGTQPCYLDGQVFGKSGGSRSNNSQIPRTHLVFPSGNGLKASDFESWFWLNVREQVTLERLEITPPRVQGNASVKGSIFLSNIAPEGGISVTLSSQNKEIIRVPRNITISEGSDQTGFTIETNSVQQTTSVLLTASLGDESRNASLTVIATPSTLTALRLNPDDIFGGNPSEGIVMLNNPAPVGGIRVNLSSSSKKIATVPKIVTVPAGETTATFPVNTNSNPPSSSITITTVIITASFAGITREDSLTVRFFVPV